MSTHVPTTEVSLPIPSISSTHLDPEAQEQSTQRSVSVSSASGPGQGVKNLKAIFEAKSDTSPSRERQSLSRRTSEAGERRTSRVRASFVSVIHAQDARDMATAQGKDRASSMTMDLGMLLKGSPFAVDGVATETKKEKATDKDKGIKIQTKAPRVSESHAKPTRTPTTPVKTISSPRAAKPRSPAVEKGLFSPKRVASITSAKKVVQKVKQTDAVNAPSKSKDQDAEKELAKDADLKAPIVGEKAAEKGTQEPSTAQSTQAVTDTSNGIEPSSSKTKPQPKAVKSSAPPKPVSTTTSSTSKSLPSAALRVTASTTAKCLSTAPGTNTSRPESRSSLSYTRPPRSSIAPINSRAKPTTTAPPSAALSTKERGHHPRASMARSELPNVQPAPTTKFVEGDFLARMTRPTASSASKAHTKVEANSPPRKLNGTNAAGQKRASVLPVVAKQGKGDGKEKADGVKMMESEEAAVKPEENKPVVSDVQKEAEVVYGDIEVETSKASEEVQAIS